MKDAILLSFDPRLFDKARDILVARGATYYAEDGDRVVQLQNEAGQLFTLYEQSEPEYDFRSPPFRAGPGVVIPDMSTINGYVIECRWEEWFAELVRDIAAVAEGGAWVLDDDSVVWRADGIDPRRIRL